MLGGGDKRQAWVGSIYRLFYFLSPIVSVVQKELSHAHLWDSDESIHQEPMWSVCSRAVAAAPSLSFCSTRGHRHVLGDAAALPGHTRFSQLWKTQTHSGRSSGSQT